ncbi:MAG: hypothetical protein KIS66_17350 [Fimbriimonadaceae bacterium]|nr:hypothetical protein [Fimbriimonadaceae bacterium]
MAPSRAEALRLVIGSVLWACALGLAVDMVTAHVAVEYFTVHHPKVVASQEPVVMALVWGIGASWWFGLIAGVVLAFVNHRLRPSLPARTVLRTVGWACLAIWLAMMLVLVGVYLFAGTIPMAQRRPTFESDRRLMAVALAHAGEYAMGTAAMIVVAFRMRRLSRRA